MTIFQTLTYLYQCSSFLTERETRKEITFYYFHLGDQTPKIDHFSQDSPQDTKVF